jgi:hypothetical protein
MAKKNDGGPKRTDVTVRADPETEVKIETAGSKGATGAAKRVLQAVQANPIPAGMIWAGLGWLALARSGSRSSAGQASSIVSSAQQSVGSVATGARGAISTVAEGTTSRDARWAERVLEQWSRGRRRAMPRRR